MKIFRLWVPVIIWVGFIFPFFMELLDLNDEEAFVSLRHADGLMIMGAVAKNDGMLRFLGRL